MTRRSSRRIRGKTMGYINEKKKRGREKRKKEVQAEGKMEE